MEDNPDNISKMYQVQQKISSQYWKERRAEILKRLYQGRDDSRKWVFRKGLIVGQKLWLDLQEEEKKKKAQTIFSLWQCKLFNLQAIPHTLIKYLYLIKSKKLQDKTLEKIMAKPRLLQITDAKMLATVSSEHYKVTV